MYNTSFVFQPCKEYTAAWCPQIVLTCQEALGGLLVRLTAVEATLLQQPLITGKYSAAAHHWVSAVSRQLCLSLKAYNESANVWGARSAQTYLQSQVSHSTHANDMLQSPTR